MSPSASHHALTVGAFRPGRVNSDQANRGDRDHMSRPDITADAQRIKKVILGGGITLLQGDVGYGVVTENPTAARRTFDVKRRAAHKRHGMLGSPEFRH